MKEKTISDVMKLMGSRGGKIGGKKAAANMTPEERGARARKAAAKSAAVRQEPKNLRLLRERYGDAKIQDPSVGSVVFTIHNPDKDSRRVILSKHQIVFLLANPGRESDLWLDVFPADWPS